jgi:uncharacterized coiled-coil protein SlyX
LQECSERLIRKGNSNTFFTNRKHNIERLKLFLDELTDDVSDFKKHETEHKITELSEVVKGHEMKIERDTAKLDRLCDMVDKISRRKPNNNV